MNSLLIDPARGIEMGRLGRERAIELFSLDQYVQRMMGVFEEIL
jgi:hypothetical protein